MGSGSRVARIRRETRDSHSCQTFYRLNTIFQKMVRSEKVVRSEDSEAVTVAFELGLQLSCKFRAFLALSPQYRVFRLFTDFSTFLVFFSFT